MKIKDEKELTNMMQNHKEEISQYIWKRKLQNKRDVRALFQGGMGMVCRFGDMISESCLESIQSFEKHNLGMLLKESINQGKCEADDIPGLLNQRVCTFKLNLKGALLAFNSTKINVAINRLEFQLTSDDISDENKWFCVYGTCGPCALKLYSKPLMKDIGILIDNQMQYNQH